MLALHASIDARRRLVRGARLAHDPEGFVVPALRTFDTRPRQGLRDLIEDERVRGRLSRLGLFFVVVRLLVVSGMAVLPALFRVSMRDPMGASGDDLLALVVVRFFFVSVPRSDQAVAA